MEAIATPSNLDRTLSALAHPARRAILRRLSAGELRVTELAEPFAMSLNAVSKHIRSLERGRLVHRRRAGREHFLSLNPQSLDAVAAWMSEQTSAWTARLSALDALFQKESRASARRKTKRKGSSK
jgi:DNA-binding transcriptional ArsR family regulator